MVLFRVKFCTKVCIFLLQQHCEFCQLKPLSGVTLEQNYNSAQAIKLMIVSCALWAYIIRSINYILMDKKISFPFPGYCTSGTGRILS